jgi:DDE domain
VAVIRGYTSAARVAKHRPISSVIDDPGQVTSGTWMQSFSPSTVNGMICGGRWIRMGPSWIFLVRCRQDKPAAKTCFRTRLKGCQYVPRVIITDQFKSSGAAQQEMLSGVEHRQHRYLSNRAEHSHQPTRQRERRMRGFTSAGQGQRGLAAYGLMAQHCRPRRHRLSASAYRQEM